MRRKGYWTLTYIDKRKIESIFEERVQALLSGELVKVENEAILVDATEEVIGTMRA